MRKREQLRGRVSRRVAAWIVGLGCVVAAAGSLILHRIDEAPRLGDARAERAASTRAVSEPSERGPEIDADDESSTQEEQQAPTPQDKRSLEERFAVPTELTKLPISKITDAKSEESRQFFWSYLRTFAAKADLTEAEWLRFLGDISDVSSSDIAAQDTAMEEIAGSTPKEVHASLEEANRLSSELALELDERCASWMTEKQLRSYRQRINATGVLMMMNNLKTFAYTASILSNARR